MNKPFDLLVADFRDQLSKAVNESRLPITMVSAVVRDLANEVGEMERQTIEHLRQQRVAHQNTLSQTAAPPEEHEPPAEPNA